MDVKSAIADHLESLESLGILVSHTEANLTRWHHAELQQASWRGDRNPPISKLLR